MIKIYEPTERLFNHNGLKILHPTKALIFLIDQIKRRLARNAAAAINRVGFLRGMTAGQETFFVAMILQSRKPRNTGARA